MHYFPLPVENLKKKIIFYLTHMKFFGTVIVSNKCNNFYSHMFIVSNFRSMEDFWSF